MIRKPPAGIPAGGFFQGPRPLKPIETAQPPAAYFSLVRKTGKSTLRGANQSGEGRALMICPLRTPILRGPRIGCASVSFRRANWDARSAAFRCRSIVLAYSASDYQTAPSLAHAVTRRVPGARPITFCCTILRVQHRKYSPTQLTLYPTLFASVPLNPISCFAAYRNLRFAISPANLPVSIPLPVSVPQCAVQHHFYLQILFFSA